MRKLRQALLVNIVLALLVCSPAFADTIPPEHLACVSDQDCALVYTSYCPCGDLRDTRAVNKKFADQDKHHSTPDEIRSCAQSGACLKSGQPAAVCQHQICAVEMLPNP